MDILMKLYISSIKEHSVIEIIKDKNIKFITYSLIINKA